jgi:hypothetical protein
MGQSTLVIEQEEKDAGAELINRISETWPVQLAFWLKPSEGDRRFLYLVAQGIDDSNIDQGYKEVYRQLAKMPMPHLDAFQVRFIQPDNSLARDVLDVHQKYPGRGSINYNGWYLGGMSIEGAYLYPLPSGSSIN